MSTSLGVLYLTAKGLFSKDDTEGGGGNSTLKSVFLVLAAIAVIVALVFGWKLVNDWQDAKAKERVEKIDVLAGQVKEQDGVIVKLDEQRKLDNETTADNTQAKEEIKETAAVVTSDLQKQEAEIRLKYEAKLRAVPPVKKPASSTTAVAKTDPPETDYEQEQIKEISKARIMSLWQGYCNATTDKPADIPACMSQA